MKRDGVLTRRRQGDLQPVDTLRRLPADRHRGCRRKSRGTFVTGSFPSVNVTTSTRQSSFPPGNRAWTAVERRSLGIDVDADRSAADACDLRKLAILANSDQALAVRCDVEHALSAPPPVGATERLPSPTIAGAVSVATGSRKQAVSDIEETFEPEL